MALSETKIKSLREPGRYSDGNNLYLQITDAGVRSWLFRYDRGGKGERSMGLGPLHTISLEDARDAARAARKLLLAGIDPLEARAAERAARALEQAKSLTFEAAARQYFDLHQSKWRNFKSRQQFLNTLEQYAFPIIGRLAVADIDTGRVLAVIEPMWRTKTETADRVRARIENVLEWATVRGYRTGDNPAKWRGHLASALPARNQIAKVVHHRALPFAEMPAFMAELAAVPGMPARALEFLILTAARTGEAVGARHSEIQRDAALWELPANRTKSNRPHRVPLSPRAAALVADLPIESDWLFPGSRKGGNIHDLAMSDLLKRMGRGETVHGFRSTFRDWAAERTTYPNHVVEMALAHAIENKSEAAYRRGELLEQRRKLMTDWARYCSVPQEEGKVVPMRAPSVS